MTTLTGTTAGTTAASPADPATILEHMPLFYDFTHHELRKIAAQAQLRTFDAREEIFRSGDAGDRIYFVISGLVRLTAHESEAVLPDDFIIRSRGVFGEDCAFDESPRGLAAEALMRTECIVLSAHSLRRLEDEHPRIAIRLIRKLARTTSLRLRQAVGKRLPVAPETRKIPASPVPSKAVEPAGRLDGLKRLLGSFRNPGGPKAVQPA